MIPQMSKYSLIVPLEWALYYVVVIIGKHDKTCAADPEEIISCVLKSMNGDGARIIEIQDQTYLSYNRLRGYSTLLVLNDLFVYVYGERRFRMTQKGIRAMKALNEINELMLRQEINTRDSSVMEQE